MPNRRKCPSRLLTAVARQQLLTMRLLGIDLGLSRTTRLVSR
jgi:hypothetical protein